MQVCIPVLWEEEPLKQSKFIENKKFLRYFLSDSDQVTHLLESLQN